MKIELLQKIGDDEGYRIRELEEGESLFNFNHDHDHDDGGKSDLYRALIAGGLWIVAWILNYNDFTTISIGAYAIGILVGGWSNFFKGFKSLAKGQFNMAVLMSVAVIGAALMGDWEEGAAVAALFSFAEYLETWSAEKGKKTLSSLLSLAPDKALRLTVQGEEEVFSSELASVIGFEFGRENGFHRMAKLVLAVLQLINRQLRVNLFQLKKKLVTKFMQELSTEQEF